MGLFEDLGVNMADVEAAGFSNPPDGYYDFEISNSEIRRGTSADPNVLKFVITYGLDEDGEATEWFTVAEDNEVTEKARKSLGFLKSRLNDLGVDADTFDPEEDDLSGIRGSLQLVTKNNFQNVRNVTLSEEEAEDEPEEEVEDLAAQDAELKKKVAAKRAAEAAKKPAAKRAPAKSTNEANPFE